MTRQYDRLLGDIEKIRKLVILGLFAGLVVFILFEALRGHHFWSKVKGEGNLWNYGSSLNDFLVAEVAILNAILIAYCDRLRRPRITWAWIPWAVMGIAFTFFACDEMLCIHEKLGAALENRFPWIGANFPGEGDGVIFMSYMVGGLAFSIPLFRSLLARIEAKRYFIAALIMIGMASGLEIVPRQLYIAHLPFRETEELLELFAGWSFTAAFLTSGAFTIERILNSHLNENDVSSKRKELNADAIS